MQGLPLRGKQAVDLEATVHSLLQSTCRGKDAPASWEGLGFARAFALERRGCTAVIPAPKSGIQVQASRLPRLSLPCACWRRGGTGSCAVHGLPWPPPPSPFLPLQVSVAQLFKPAADEGQAPVPVADDTLLVEASVVCDDDAYREACGAIGAGPCRG